MMIWRRMARSPFLKRKTGGQKEPASSGRKETSMAYFFGWRVSVLALFIASVLLTPADPLSTCGVAVCLLLVDWALYAVLKRLGVGSPLHSGHRA
jgi:hypothetical protein